MMNPISQTEIEAPGDELAADVHTVFEPRQSGSRVPSDRFVTLIPHKGLRRQSTALNI